MYGAWMIARQCITVSGVKTELLLSVTIVVNGEEGGVGTLGSESCPTCLPLRLAYQAPVKSCLTFWISSGKDSVMEQIPAHHSYKQTIQKVELYYEKENMTTLKNNTVQRNENCSADCMCCSSFRKVIASTIQPDPQLRILKEVDRMFPFMI